MNLSLHAILAKIFLGVITAPTQPKQRAVFELQSILDPKKSDYKRVASIVNVGDRMIPGLANRLSLVFTQKNHFPWTSGDLELIGSGAGAVVYKLNSGGRMNALRIYRKSIGQDVQGLLETVKFYKESYKTILSWYGSACNLVLPMDFLLLQGPPLTIPVVASLQPYVQGQKKDFFDDFSNDELVTLMENDLQLREQFNYFATKTVQLCDKRELGFDFFGRENLLLVNQEGNNRLYILDTGLFDFKTVKRESQNRVSQIENRINRLKFLHSLVKQQKLAGYVYST